MVGSNTYLFPPFKRVKCTRNTEKVFQFNLAEHLRIERNIDLLTDQ